MTVSHAQQAASSQPIQNGSAKLRLKILTQLSSFITGPKSDDLSSAVRWLLSEREGEFS